MSDESDSEIEFNMDKRETVEKNNEDSALNTVKQGQGDMESEFNDNIRDDMVRQRNTVETERNFEVNPGVLYFENNNSQERKWGNAPRFGREQLPIAGHPATIRPDAYSGSDWEEYYSHFQDCAELGRWSMEDRVLTLAASLKGPARTFYMSLPSHERRTYNILVRRLEERFGSARQQNRWLSRFEMRKRNSGETVAALGDDLRQMVQKAYCNLNSMAQEVLALNQLYKSIPLEMKCRCVDRECKTVGDAVDIIERYEALLGESSDKKKTSVCSVSYENCIENKADMEWQNNVDPNVRLVSQQPNNDKTIQMLISRIDKLENQTQNKGNRSNFRFGQTNYQNGRNTQNQRTCFICDSPDHFYRQCSMYTGPKFRENKPPNSHNFRNFRPNTTLEPVQGNDHPLIQ